MTTLTTSAQSTRVARLCRLIDSADTPPRLADLAARVGLSPWYLQRRFKAETGVSPREYAEARRSARLEASLAREPSVTQAMYAAGLGSTSRLHAAARARLGMTPSRYRQGGPDVRIRYSSAPCSLGRVLVAETDLGVCAIQLGNSHRALLDELRTRFPNATLSDGRAAMRERVAAVVRVVDTSRLPAALPLDIRGTAFQQRVWLALRRIKPGSTSTYTRVARAIGRPEAVRAVASAIAANPLAVAIPCHRVLRGDGNLAGYRWGIERKTKLLAREAKARD